MMKKKRLSLIFLILVVATSFLVVGGWDSGLNDAVFWLNMSDHNTSYVKDSINGINGQKLGASSPLEIGGKVGEAQQFNTSNYLNFSTDIINGSQAISVGMWVYRNDSGNTNLYSFDFNSDGNDSTFKITSNKLYFGRWTGATTTFNFNNSILAVETGKWVFVGFTKPAGSTSVTFWVNDTNETQTLKSSSAGRNGVRWIGSDTSSYLNGSIDEFFVYNRQLNSTEWLTIYNNGFGCTYGDCGVPTASFSSPVDRLNHSSSSIDIEIIPTDSLDSTLFTGIYLNDSGWNLNSTNGTSYNNTKTNHSLTLPDGIYTYAGFVNDSQNQKQFTSTNRTILIDTILPKVNDTSVSTTAGSFLISFGFNATDTNLENCFYTIFTSTYIVDPSTTENSSVTCSSSGNLEAVSSTGNYVLRVWANDTASNYNYTEENFTVSSGSGTPTGGGGSGTPLTTTPGKTTITTTNYQDKVNVYLPEKSIRLRKVDFIITNRGTETSKVTIACSTEGTQESTSSVDICDYVRFSQTQFEVSPNEQLPSEAYFEIQPPPNANYGDKYFFNIIVLNSDDSSKLSVRASISIWGNLQRWTRVIGIELPVALFSSLFALIGFAGSLVILRNAKKPGTGIITAIIISPIIFVFFMIIL